MNVNFISIQGSYKNIELSLFKDSQFCFEAELDAKTGSSLLIPSIDQILTENSLILDDLSFIAVNSGPGAFTSLRVVIATVNAVAFSSNVPLIGIDGLDSLAMECFSLLDKQKYKVSMVVSLLNAFNKDVFYGVYKVENESNLFLQKPNGYQQIDFFLERLKKDYSEDHILFVGNGVSLFKKEIETIFYDKFLLQENLPVVVSSRQIGELALKKWGQGQGLVKELSPGYLKQQIFKPKYS